METSAGIDLQFPYLYGIVVMCESLWAEILPPVSADAGMKRRWPGKLLSAEEDGLPPQKNVPLKRG